MSTNYYFIEKESRKRTEEHNEQVKQILQATIDQLEALGCDSPEEVFKTIDWQFEMTELRIHIGKRSGGWRPLFEVCEHFESVREMKKWYMNNRNEYIIEDEYGVELNWLELENELFHWKGKNTHIGRHYEYISYFLDKDGYEWTRSEFS